MSREKNLQHVHRVLVICKDTGAANAFSVFVKNWFSPTTLLSSVCVEYAVDVFKKNGIIPTKESSKDLAERQVQHILDEIQPDALLIGTSLDSWTERFFCKHARIYGIPNIGYVDWWSNFGARFSTPHTNDLAYLPDRIAVMDEDARLGCIADGIPKDILCVIGNPYWDYLVTKKENTEQLRQQVREQLGIPKHTLLAMVFSSNIRNLHLNLGYDEHDFWQTLLPLPEHSAQGTPIQWALKQHPREQQKDIVDMLNKFDIHPLIVNTLSAIEALAAADYVIGMCSSALFEAALLGKKVISLQPGLTTGKLEYLRIFHHISVPMVVNVSEIKDIVDQLINNQIEHPNLKKIPTPIGNGTANTALKELLLTGFRN